MAKTLGKLRQQTAKLRELEAPSDVSKGTKAFVKKHVYVVHPDANENDDDVFKATNVKRAKRAPDHGYEPGQDADIYEGYDDIDTDHREARRLLAKAAKKRRDAESLKDDHRSSRVAMGHRLSDEADEHEEDAKKLIKRSGKYRSEETEVSEARERPLKKNGKLIPQDPHGDYWGNGNTLDLTSDMQDPAQAKQMKSFSKRIPNAVVPRPDVRRNSVIAKDLAKMQARKQNGVEESYEETEDRNSDHHYLHTHILDALEGIHKTIGAHVNLMDNMNDKHHERSLNTLHKLHDSLLDFSERVSAIHAQARRTLGMHNETPPKPNHVTDVGGRAMLSPSIAGQTGPGKYAEDFEHIAGLSEGDQALLVNTYNSLSEDNQEKFLALAETPEGVDKLLDFAITNSKGIK
jgi:hypothetical protein